MIHLPWSARSWLGPVLCLARRHGRGILLALLAACIMILSGRPRLLTNEAVKVGASTILNSRKPTVAEKWSDFRINAVPLKQFAISRTYGIVNGDEVNLLASESQGSSVNIEARSDTNPTMTGSAAAVGKDGYLLTAAHCVDDGPVHVLCPSANGSVEPVEARVVWTRTRVKQDPDLAVIHIPRDLPCVFSLEETEINTGSPVFAGGFGNETGPALNLSAGTILDPESPQSQAQASPQLENWKQFTHTTPTAQGDSGGPVFNEQGILLGVNASLNARMLRWMDKNFLLSYHSTAVSPDVDWLHHVLNADRAIRLKRVQ